MNYHDIDYMIRERQKEEREAGEKQRLLTSTGYPQAALIGKAGNSFVHAVCRLQEHWSFRCRRLYPCFSMAHNVAPKEGGHQ